VTILRSIEQQSDAPLFMQQVEAIRDEMAVVAMSRRAVEAMSASRGFRDIDPTRCWDAWCEARAALPQGAQGRDSGRLPTSDGKVDFELSDAFSAIGKASSTAEVKSLVERLGTVERYDDPPGRYYLTASQNGVSLLFEEELLSDIQIRVEASDGKEQCPFRLPFGLKRGMFQADVHRVLGEPASSDEFDSQYFLDDQGIRLFLGYVSETGLLRYISLAPIAQWRR